jgi:hypothetical protein
MNFCDFTCIESVVTKTPTKITLRENSSTTNAIIQWDLLVKKYYFGKSKSLIAVTFTCDAPFSSSFSKINSSSIQSKQLKCVFSYPLAMNVGVKRGIITYKITNKISALQECLNQSPTSLQRLD